MTTAALLLAAAAACGPCNTESPVAAAVRLPRSQAPQARPVGDTSRARIGPDSAAQTLPPRRPSRLWTLDARVSSVYDSNIDHDEVALDSYGTVARAGVGVRSSASDPVVSADYVLRVYRFTNTTRWNRLQHDFGLTLAAPTDRVRPRLRGEVRLGSATEDRELANQYIVEPGVDVEVNDRVDLELYAVQRLKRYIDAVDRDETNRYAGADLDVEVLDWLDWTVGGRYEVNDGERDSRDYTRVTVDTELAIALGQVTGVELALRRRFRDYTDERVATLDDVLRADRRWTTGVLFTRWLADVWQVRLEYEADLNDSNQVAEDFRSHRVELTLRRRW